MDIDGIPYTPDGWLDIKEIKKRCPEAVFFWIIGARQIGKTYGIFDYLHEQPGQYVFMRHNAEELKFANSSKINAFKDKGFPWAEHTWNAKGTPLLTYNDEYHEGKIPKVISTCLSAVGKVRGIPAMNIDYIFFDEFIPVNQLTSKDTDGKNLQDFYFTINSVREYEGKPPVEMWCAANSNSLASPILSHWGLTGEFLNMVKRGQHFKYIPQRRLCLITVDNSPVSKELQKSALFQCLGINNDYAKMAIENAFVDDDSTGVKSRPIKEYRPMCSVDDVTFYVHKRRDEWYIVDHGPRTNNHYTTKNPTSYSAFMQAWRFQGLCTPIDGETIFYNSYPAKLKAYKILRLDKK